jgi:hypothetical protein
VLGCDEAERPRGMRGLGLGSLTVQQQGGPGAKVYTVDRACSQQEPVLGVGTCMWHWQHVVVGSRTVRIFR